MKAENKLIELIQAIIKRPQMYSVENIDDLSLVCLGFSYGTLASNPDSVGDFLLGFQKFVAKKLKGEGEHSWANLIRFYSGSNKQSLEVFNKLFNEYLEMKP